jgi:hypothetical protein
VTTADAGSIDNCQHSCDAAHPSGSAACEPYYACGSQQCLDGNGC